MLFGDFLFMNVNLVKAGIFIGFYEIISICFSILIDVEVVTNRKNMNKM